MDVMSADTLRIDIPTGKNELATLKAAKVGDVRKGLLFPSIPADVEWTCTVAKEFEWQFEGKFCGLPVATVDIVIVNSSLVLTVKEGCAE